MHDAQCMLVPVGVGGVDAVLIPMPKMFSYYIDVNIVA